MDVSNQTNTRLEDVQEYGLILIRVDCLVKTIICGRSGELETKA